MAAERVSRVGEDQAGKYHRAVCRGTNNLTINPLRGGYQKEPRGRLSARKCKRNQNLESSIWLSTGKGGVLKKEFKNK